MVSIILETLIQELYLFVLLVQFKDSLTSLQLHLRHLLLKLVDFELLQLSLILQVSDLVLPCFDLLIALSLNITYFLQHPSESVLPLPPRVTMTDVAAQDIVVR